MDVFDAAQKRPYDDDDQADQAKKARLDPISQFSDDTRDTLQTIIMHLAIEPAFCLMTLLDNIHKDKSGSSWISLDLSQARGFLKEHPQLIELIKKQDLDALLAEDCLRTRTMSSVDEQSVLTHERGADATLNSWNMPFKGSSDPLYTTISQYMKQDNTDKHYARCAAFTQSSGTGKSRMNDELAKKIVYIPVNLGQAAFPPSDPYAFSYFEDALKLKPGGNMSTKELASQQTKVAHSFIHALLEIAYDRLADVVREVANDAQSGDRLQIIASRFREKMREGMTFTKHGPYRVKFYEDVHERATRHMKTVEVKTDVSESGSPRKIEEDIVVTRAWELVSLLDIHNTVTSDGPLVIICFDEAHTLTKMYAGTSFFFELRRVLRNIKKLPIFTLFLSTTGSLEQFSPPPHADASERVEKRRLILHPPISLTPLDVLAKKFNPAGEWQLQKVASTPHMVHLGRPLFASRYDAGDSDIRDGIFSFALTKLLCSHDDDPSLFAVGDREGLLACLGVRIPFDFKRFNDSLERKMVSHHMRLLLHAAPGFTSVVTASVSEPVLAEAAYRFMGKKRWSQKENRFMAIQPYNLLDHAFTQTEIDLGTRGEIVAAALLMDARDRATTYNSRKEAETAKATGTSEQPTVDAPEAMAQAKEEQNTRERIITVEQFLRALLGDEMFEKLGECRPTVFRLRADKPLKEAFETANIYFNHFIKVDSFEVINQEFLLLAISRGAAIICANNFGGIDIVVPMLVGTVLAKEFVSAILVQVKNSREYTTNVRRALFVAMNPYACGLFDAAVTDAPPVLRMVCALASKKSSVVMPPAPTRRSSRGKGDKFTAYDIWCAGAFHNTFDVIDPAEEGTLASLLLNMRDPRDVFRRTDKALHPTLRQMLPSTAPDPDHYTNWVEVLGDASKQFKTVTVAEDVDEGAELLPEAMTAGNTQ